MFCSARGKEEINFRLNLSVKQARYLLDLETDRHESLKSDAALRISRHALHVLAVVDPADLLSQIMLCGENHG